MESVEADLVIAELRKIIDQLNFELAVARAVIATLQSTKSATE